jgi:hypothetical protein
MPLVRQCLRSEPKQRVVVPTLPQWHEPRGFLIMLVIENQAQVIKSTNFWDTPHALSGFFYLSWNAGAGRLLIPDSQKPMIAEVRSAKYVIVSRGPWTDQGGRDAIELLFEDGSDEPYCIHLAMEQCDRAISESEQGGGFVIALWTRTGLKQRLPGKYRVVPRIPYLEPWGEH